MMNYRILVPLIALIILALTVLITNILSLDIKQQLTGSRLNSLPLTTLEPTPATAQTPPDPPLTIVPSLKTQLTPTQVYIPQHSGRELRVPILFYHYIGNNPNPADTVRTYLSVPPDIFEQQIKYLSDNGYHTISLDTLYPGIKGQLALPDKPIILTFDDGYTDFYHNAYPILRKYNMKATVFIPTGLMNQGYYLNWNQIREMYASGLITFGAHTVRHVQLTSLSGQSMEYELSESKRVLQQELGVPINFISYPYGSVNTTVIEAVKRAGYLGGVGTWANKIQSEGTIYNMPRLRVGGGVDLPYFISLL